VDQLHQTNTKMIAGPFYTYRWIHFTSGNAQFLRYFWKIDFCE